MRMTGKEVLLGLVFAGAAVGVAMMGSRDAEPYPYLFDRTKATTDQQRFLASVVQYNHVTEAEMQPLTPRLRAVWRDLPMIVYVSRQADRPLQDIAEMRRAGQDWIDIYRKLDLPLKALFEGVPGTAPEPYKASWTEWRMKYRPVLDDQQMKDLALLQMARAMSGEEMADVLKKVRKGTTPEQIIARYEPPAESPSPAAAALKDEKTPAPDKKHSKKTARVE